MTKFPSKQKGFGIISLIILIAFVFAAINVYAYFNPSFSLAKYSPLNYFRQKLDDERVGDLKSLEKAIVAYYELNNKMPANDGWCGRISGVLHQEVADAIRDYFPNKDIPNDPVHNATEKDYFYYRVDRAHYILMAVLDIPRDDHPAKNYAGCHDWPGDDVYNYQIDNLNTN